MSGEKLKRELRAAIAHGESFGPSQGDMAMLDLPAPVLREVLLEHADAAGGLRLHRVRVTGDLDLEAQRIGPRLRFEDCHLDGVVILIQARASNIELIRCHLRDGLVADQLDLRWNLDLDASTIENGLELHSATIGGRLSLNTAVLSGYRDEDRTAGFAVRGDGATVGAVFCQKLSATGEMRLLGARTGVIVMSGAALEGHRDADGGMRPALNADGAVVSGGLFCDRLSTVGEVRLVGTEISGQVGLQRATLKGHRQENGVVLPALNACAAELAGGLHCANLSAAGEVRLRGAKIGVQLSMDGATLVSPVGEDGAAAPALDAGGTEIAGSALWPRLSTTGSVWLVGAKIVGQLAMQEATLAAHVDEDGIPGQALVADRIEVDGSVFCTAVTATGEISLSGARIGGQLELQGAKLSSPDPLRPGLTLIGARVDELVLALARADGMVDLRDSRVRSLWDAIDGRLAGHLPERLRLEGFKYEALREPLDAQTRLEWVARSQQDNHVPGVYGELADAFRRIGRRGDARKVGVANERRARRDSPRWSPRGLWSDLLFVTVGYGYRNWLALLWLLVPLAVGTAAFSIWEGSFTHAGENPPPLVPVLYAIDATVPILELGQTRWWSATGGMAWVELGLAALGYALVAALIAAAAGLFNRDQV